MIEFCLGCRKKHEDSAWKRTEDGWRCHLHFTSYVSMAKKMDSLSPEEVLSGAQYGIKTDWGKPRSKSDWGKEHREQTRAIKDALG